MVVRQRPLRVPSQTHARLLDLQKKIYRGLRARSRTLLGEPSPGLRGYEREYRRDFRGLPERLAVLTKDQLLAQVRRSDVTFIADFHTFPQAQRTALRLIRDAVRPGERWLIGLELVPSQYQSTLDAFLAGKLSAEAFRQIIRYDDSWGFPWENYAPIFEWARENQVRLIALNLPEELRRPGASTLKELHARDRWAAGIVSDLLALKPRTRMIVLYGELHVGTAHLPARLRELWKESKKRTAAPRLLSVHQNDDALYWQLARERKELHSEIVRLGPESVCVFSSTPWARLQSLIGWIEGDPSQLEEDDSTDALSLVQTYGNTLAEFFRVLPPPYAALNVHTIDNADFVEALAREKTLTAEQLRLVRFHVMGNFKLYVPPSAIYLASPSQNSAAEMASIHLLRSYNRSKALFVPERDDFFRMALESAFGFFGSLIVNPRRKCDLRADHQARFEALRRGAPAGFPLELEARRGALVALSPRRKGRALSVLMSTRKLAPAAMVAARFTGYALGKRLHKALLNGRVTIEQVRDFFFSRPHPAQPSFEERHEALVRWISAASVESSKRDTL